MKKSPVDEHELLFHFIEGLQAYDDDDKLRLLRTVLTYFDLDATANSNGGPRKSVHEDMESVKTPVLSRRLSFSDHPDMTPKEFLQQKAPRTDLERVACLAYYLAHYRDANSFKTLDINKLNTEAAQAKFSNASNAVENATKQGYLAPAGKGMKQLSADGERFVDVLPDRESAKELRSRFARRRPRKQSSKKRSTSRR